MGMKVCILMASYNGDKYIAEQIDSILNQDGVDLTLYISDDFSTDETSNIIQSYLDQNNVHLLQNKNKYGTAGKNFFSMIARVDFDNFDFVAFADQDDVWNIDKLLNSALYIKQTKGCVGVSSCVEAFWPDGRTVYVDKASPQKDFDYFFEPAGPGCTYLFTASFANELKSLLILKPWINALVFYHDWLVYAYARKMEYGWHIFPSSTLRYRQHNTNETGVNSGFSAFKKRIEKLRSGWYLDQVYAIANAVGYENDMKYYFPVRAKPNLRFYANFVKMRRKLSDAFVLSMFFLFKIAR